MHSRRWRYIHFLTLYFFPLYSSNALKEIFARHDLDGNGTISINEFDLFHERTSKEVCDDDSWKVLEGLYKRSVNTRTIDEQVFSVVNHPSQY